MESFNLEVKLISMVKYGHPQVNKKDSHKCNDPLDGDFSVRFCKNSIILREREKVPSVGKEFFSQSISSPILFNSQVDNAVND